VIEQAKGFLAERAAIGVEEAFHLIRQHARNSGQLLVNVARRVIDGTIETNEIIR
jgi:AmiR/NasT family two-component response regulator